MDQLPTNSPRANVLVADNHPLAGVVHRLSFEALNDGALFRRYGGSLSTTSRIEGRVDVGSKRIQYRIGMRSTTKSLSMLHTAETERFCQVIDLNDELHNELSARIRKHINVNPDYVKADLSAVIYRLSASLAYYAVHGDLTTQVMRGGRHLKVTAVNSMTTTMPTEAHVFVPRTVDTVRCPAAFSALANAICGEGAMVVTDAVEINPDTNAARIPGASGMRLAHGCLIALRTLFYMYETSGQGAVAALAFTKGIHSVMTVASHTDEGGYLRDVLRGGRFQVPFGGIYCDKAAGYTHFPVFSVGDRAGLQSLLDGAALKTAAAAALADPLTELGGRHYPTIFTVGRDCESGTDDGEATLAQNRGMAGQIAMASGTFAERYSRILGEIVVGDGGGGGLASMALQGMFHLAASSRAANRHLVNKVVHPFYWVEPTSLFERKDQSDATMAGYGVMAGLREPATAGAYPEHTVTIPGTYNVGISYQHRATRTVPGLVHMYLHQRDGLAGVVPYQMRPEKVALMGGGHDAANPASATVRQAMMDGNNLGQYSWRHGDCELPCPAELMYIGARVGAQLRLATPDPVGYGTTRHHVVSPYDGLGLVDVTYIASRPEALPMSRGAGLPAAVRRSRGRAEYALHRLHDHVHMGVNVAAASFTMQFEEPGSFERRDTADEYQEAEEVQGITPPYIPRGPQPQDGAPRPPIYIDQAHRLPIRRGPGGGGGRALAEEVAPGHGLEPVEEGVGQPPAPPAVGANRAEEDGGAAPQAGADPADQFGEQADAGQDVAQ